MGLRSWLAELNGYPVEAAPEEEDGDGAEDSIEETDGDLSSKVEEIFGGFSMDELLDHELTPQLYALDLIQFCLSAALAGHEPIDRIMTRTFYGNEMNMNHLGLYAVWLGRLYLEVIATTAENMNTDPIAFLTRVVSTVRGQQVAGLQGFLSKEPDQESGTAS